MHGYSGHHPSQMRAGKRRTVREISTNADSGRGGTGHIVGKRLRNGSWVRVSPQMGQADTTSNRGARRFNNMVAGMSVGSHMGAADTSGNRGVRRYNNMVYGMGHGGTGPQPPALNPLFHGSTLPPTPTQPDWRPGMPRRAMMPSSLRGVRRYNQMVAGVSVSGPSGGSGDPQDGGIQVNWGDDLDNRRMPGFAWAPHMNPVSSSVRSAEAYDEMASRRVAGPSRRAAHRRQMANQPFLQRGRPQPSPLGWQR